MQPDNKRNITVYMVDSLGRGGICQYTHDLTERMTNHNCKVVLVTTKDYELSNTQRSFQIVQILFQFAPGARSTSLLAKSVRLFKRIWNFAALTLYIATRRRAYIHYQNFLGRFFHLHLRMVRFVGHSVIYTAHDVFSHDEETADMGFYKGIYQLSDKVILLTEYSETLLKERLPEVANKTTVIPLGSGYSAYTHPYVSPKETNTLLFFGNIAKYKGLEVLLAAFNKVVDKIPDAKLIVAGRIVDQTMAQDDYSSILNPHALERVIFDIGYVGDHEIQSYFTQASLIVLPYISATQSGVALLAYSFGRAVVASRVGGLPEQVEENRTGRLVAPGDVDELASAICSMLSVPGTLYAMGKYAKEMSETRFSWESIAIQTTAEYRKTCSL